MGFRNPNSMPAGAPLAATACFVVDHDYVAEPLPYAPGPGRGIVPDDATHKLWCRRCDATGFIHVGGHQTWRRP